MGVAIRGSGLVHWIGRGWGGGWNSEVLGGGEWGYDDERNFVT